MKIFVLIALIASLSGSAIAEVSISNEKETNYSYNFTISRSNFYPVDVTVSKEEFISKKDAENFCLKENKIFSTGVLDAFIVASILYYTGKNSVLGKIRFEVDIKEIGQDGKLSGLKSWSSDTENNIELMLNGEVFGQKVIKFYEMSYLYSSVGKEFGVSAICVNKPLSM